MRLTRRNFLHGCSAAIAAMAGARLTRVALAAPGRQTAATDTLVVLFLRGGWDALNVVPVIDGPDRGIYEQARPALKLPRTGANAALRLDDQFGLHPGLAPLLDLYQAGHMGIVHAVGLNFDTRSHFDAMQFIELGIPGRRGTADGWISRHLLSSPVPTDAVLSPALAIGGQPQSLQNAPSTMAIDNLNDFALWGNDSYLPEQRDVLNHLYTGTTWAHRAGAETLRAIDSMAGIIDGDYTPANGADYGESEIGNSLQSLARLIKADQHLQVATVDYGGWDTHDWQGEGGGGQFGSLLENLGQGLRGFYDDLGERANSTTVMVISEFGRRLEENGSYGTDHGHGSVMLLLGGGVNGGRVHGQWPGLDTEQLYDRVDLAITTDYRQVVGEVLTGRLGNSRIDAVFPGFEMGTPLGLVRPTA